MPTSLTPPPKDDETECGNCGAYIYDGLLKCPKCGVYLVDPVDTEPEERPRVRPKSRFSLAIEIQIDPAVKYVGGTSFILYDIAHSETGCYADLPPAQVPWKTRTEPRPVDSRLFVYTQRTCN